VCLVYVERHRPRRTDSLSGLTSDAKNVLALAEARAAAAGVPYEAKLAQGDVTTMILDTATQQQCDVIILGSRGLTGFKRLMLGSISYAVFCLKQKTVLIVKRCLLPSGQVRSTD